MKARVNLNSLKIKKRLLIFTAICLLTDVAYSQCEPISAFPWTEGFENNGTEIPPCWTHIITGDNNWKWNVVLHSSGTPNTAYEGNYKARSFYETNTPVHLNRSLFITPVFDLTTLNKPVLIYWHTQTEKGSLRVYYKNAPNAEWKMYLQTFSYKIPEWKGEIVLLPNKSEHYQIGFESVFSGTGIAEIQLDNIRIMEFVDIVDVELVKIITPVSGENLTNNEPIKILLKNNGSEPLTGFTLQLELDGSLIATETFTGSIPSLEQVEYTFPTTINLSAETAYQIKVAAIAENDIISSNNLKTTSITNIICPKITSFPWHESFENHGTNFPKCWNLENGGWQWAVVPISMGMPDTAYDGNYKAQLFLNFIGLPVYSARLITPVFDLSEVDKPILNFWHTQTGPCHLVVRYKNSPNGEWILLKSFFTWEVGDIPDWQEETISLPEKSDYYKISFDGTFLGGGIADLQLDDISLFDEAMVSIIETFETSAIKIYPNPTNDKFIVEYEGGIVSIKLYNMLGKELLTQTANGKTEINITSLPQGVYNVGVLSEGRVIGKSKIVKY